MNYNDVPANVKELAKHLEGLPGGKPALIAYKDQGRPPTWTNGWGHTDGVTEFTGPITEDEAEKNLDIDLMIAAHGVDSCVTVQLTPNERGALILFVLNEGVAAFAGSTLLKLLNAGNYDGALAQFDKWVYVHIDGKAVISRGLQARRTTEEALWQTPVGVDPGTPTTVLVRTHDTGSAVPPPTSVMQTKTGQVQTASVITGSVTAVVEGINHAKDISDAAHSAVTMTAGLPEWMSLALVITIVASIVFSAWTILIRHRQVQGEPQP